MENEVGRVVGLPELGEKPNVGNGILEVAVEERVVAVTSDELKEVIERDAVVMEEKVEGAVTESIELKDLEDEVFEEAVDSHEETPKEGITAELGTTDNAGSVVGAENSGAGNEVETFVEAVGVHDQDVSLEVPTTMVVEDKVEVLSGGESIDKVNIPEVAVNSEDVASVVVEDKVKVLSGGESIGQVKVSEEVVNSEDVASVVVEDKVEVLPGGESIGEVNVPEEVVNSEDVALMVVEDKVEVLLGVGRIDGVDDPEKVVNSEDVVSVVVEDKVEVVLGGESIDKIDEGGTSKEFEINESLAETCENEGHEVSNGNAEVVVTCEETIISRDILLPEESGKKEEDPCLPSENSDPKDIVDVVEQWVQVDKGKEENENDTKLDIEHRDDTKVEELNHDDTVVIDSVNGVANLVTTDEKQEDVVSNGELKAESLASCEEVKDILVVLDTPVPEAAATPSSVEELVPEEAATPVPVPLEAPVVIEEEGSATSVIASSSEKHEDEKKKEVIQPSVSIPLEAPVVKEAAAAATPVSLITSSSEKRKDEMKKEVIQPPAVEEKSDGGDIKTVIAEGSGKKVETNKTEDKQEIDTAHRSNGVRGVQLPPPKIASTSQKPGPPAGLGRASLLEPAQRPAQQQRVNGTTSNAQSQQIDESGNTEGEEFDETREKLQMIRVKFLRLAHRLGQTPHNVVVAQVLYRLGLAEQLRGRNGGRVGAFSFDRASAMAEQLEAVGQEPLDFSCTIMVLGKSGVGKSATINSIFDEVKFDTNAFQSGTKKVQAVVGTVQGIKVQVIDTPGLLPSWSEQRQNEKILNSVKKFIKNTPPDIVLYLDRLDMQSRDFGDMPLLRTITDIFGPSIWFNAIVVLTHAASAPPEGPNGTVSSYDMFVTQRSHIVQQAIRQAAGDMRLMNPVSLVENHSACRTNRAGQRVLPNGQVWKPHLLLLSFASKILAEANALLKLQDSPPGKPHVARSRAPPLPFLLSSLLQSRPQVKLPTEDDGGEDDDSDDDELEGDEESEYDLLPPFKSLTKAQIKKLTKDQKKAYFEELEYREKLFMKKQLSEEKKRRKLMKQMAAEYSDSIAGGGEEEEGGGPATSVPVPLPDFSLPASFDSDNPTHRYRSLDNSNRWFIRPVLDSHGWDHDIGYDGINAERLFVVKEKIPLSFSGQVTKDKKDANVQMEVASSIKHGKGKKKASSMGFDMQTVGKDLAYTLRGETMLGSFKKNKATAGVSVTLLGDALSAGAKFEDKLVVNKRFRMVMSGGAMAGRSDVAYGGSLEAQVRDKDYPLGRSLSTLGISVMDWHGDLAVGCNLQSQIPVGRSTNLIARANLNNKGAGQISMRLNSSEQLQIALVGLVPLLQKLFCNPQQLQYGQ
ncbi:unnamed protein product [Linum tenue]|uniref:AIG1-type G domain-containing protein n=1 Tax=Linum tenue TaxID=586396 RepID=A0AAV0MHE1_9ROSI|nr:unnamed protein product [Linum tenue]